jgi:hypothetical protein
MLQKRVKMQEKVRVRKRRFDDVESEGFQRMYLMSYATVAEPEYEVRIRTRLPILEPTCPHWNAFWMKGSSRSEIPSVHPIIRKPKNSPPQEFWRAEGEERLGFVRRSYLT